MSGPNFPYPQPRAIRRHRLPHLQGRARSKLWLTQMMAIVFVAALAGFQYAPDRTMANALVASSTPLMRGDALATDALSVRFGLCPSGGGQNCVVDGDTFWFGGEKYRIADIDTPETHPARCAEEAVLGKAATERLRRWLNDGAFSFEGIGRDSDVHGRKLRIVTRGGTSVGSVLVAEGLARPWEGRRRGWC